jgi:hypothetical protein
MGFFEFSCFLLHNSRSKALTFAGQELQGHVHIITTADDQRHPLMQRFGLDIKDIRAVIDDGPAATCSLPFRSRSFFSPGNLLLNGR